MMAIVENPAKRRGPELARRTAPSGESWLVLAMNAARAEGALFEDVIGGSRMAAAARARRRLFCELRTMGCSLEEIAKPWGCHHTTILFHLGLVGQVRKPALRVQLCAAIEDGGQRFEKAMIVTVSGFADGRLRLLADDGREMDGVHPAHVQIVREGSR